MAWCSPSFCGSWPRRVAPPRPGRCARARTYPLLPWLPLLLPLGLCAVVDGVAGLRIAPAAHAGDRVALVGPEGTRGGEGRAGSGSGGAVDPMTKPIKLRAWGVDPGEAISQIMDQSDVDVIIAPSFLRPEEFKAVRVYLHADNMPVRQAVQWLAAALGCRYRRRGPRSVLLTGSYDWVKSLGFTNIIEPVESLVGEDAPGFERGVREVARIQALFGRNAYLRFEQPAEPIRAGRLVGVLPKRTAAILGEVLQAMNRQGAPIGQAPPHRLDEAELALAELLLTPVPVSFRERPLLEVLTDLQLATRPVGGLNIGFDHRPLHARRLPRITLPRGERPLREVLREIAAQLGMAGMQVSYPRGIWFTAVEQPSPWTPMPEREIPWETLRVRSYDATPLAATPGGARAVPHRIRQTVQPAAWRELGTSVIYHQHSGNLIVVAPEPVQVEVLRALVRMVKTAPSGTPPETAATVGPARPPLPAPAIPSGASAEPVERVRPLADEVVETGRWGVMIGEETDPERAGPSDRSWPPSRSPARPTTPAPTPTLTPSGSRDPDRRAMGVQDGGGGGIVAPETPRWESSIPDPETVLPQPRPTLEASRTEEAAPPTEPIDLQEPGRWRIEPRSEPRPGELPPLTPPGARP